MPLTLYAVVTKPWNAKYAFLSVFFFMAFSGFIAEMPFLPRQGYAELFLALWILLIVDKQMPRLQKGILSVLFAVGIITSHYAISYIVMYYLAFSWIVLLVLRKATLRSSMGLISFNFIALFVVFSLMWYIYVGQAFVFDYVVRMGDHIYNSIYTELLAPGARPAALLTAIGLGPPVQHGVEWAYRIIFWITEIFIIFGFFRTILKRGEWETKGEYLAMSLGAMSILGLTIVLPYFAGYLNIPRFYHISLIFLAPFCIIGGRSILGGLLRLLRKIWDFSPGVNWLNIMMAAVLIIFFIFQTGFPFIIAGMPSMNRFNISNIERYGTPEDKTSFYSGQGYVFKQELASAKWLDENRKKDMGIMAGPTAAGRALASYVVIRDEIKALYPIVEGKGEIPWALPGWYSYLGYANVVHDLLIYVSLAGSKYEYLPMSTVSIIFERSNRIYANGTSEAWILFKHTYAPEEE